MTTEKKICCGIMLCQMTAILTGTSLMYLTFVVVTPSLREISFNFHDDPIMCTTVLANDTTAGGKKAKCEWSTCNEWCLSKTSTPCMQIFVMPRRAGAETVIGDCELETNEACSTLNVSLTNKKLCKKGECSDISGLFNCSKWGENECTDISAGYACTRGKLNKTSKICDKEKCESRLSGIYHCTDGACNRIDGIISYKDCERKCENLTLSNKNTIIFSNDKLMTGRCSFINSSNTELSNLTDDSSWISGDKYLFIFCSFVDGKREDGKTTFKMKDCFNATLRNKNDVANIRSFLKLVDIRNNVPSDARWLLPLEESLRIMNNTNLTINAEGCVNTLSKECRSFFLTRTKDGRDGRTADRFPCYYTNATTDFVIGKYDPKATFLLLILTSCIPTFLFAFACFCLFFCSKSVGVDEGGHLKVTLLKKGGATPRNASEL